VNEAGPTSRCARLKLTVRGAVQGVGFRPFIFRLATGLGLAGWVNNSSQGVFIEAEGPRAELEKFLLRLEKEKPPRSFIQSLEASWLDPAGYTAFEIRPSETGGNKTALVLPDIATCPDCLREIFDPQNRRHHYPFTNCTHCGPRFSIIESLPYDRANTSMKKFMMCRNARPNTTTRATAASTPSRMRARFVVRGWNFGRAATRRRFQSADMSAYSKITMPCSLPPKRFVKVESSRSKDWADFI